MALLRNGQPRFPCLAPYCGENPSKADIAWFAQREVGGAFTFEELKRYRDLWKGPMVIKGVMHPADAETAVAIGSKACRSPIMAAANSRRHRLRWTCCRRSRAPVRTQGHGSV